MSFRKIVIGYDSSEYSKKALDTGLVMAQKLGSSLVVVTVLRNPEFSATIDEIDESFTHAEKQVRPWLDELKKVYSAQGVEIETAILRGHPAESIVKFAAECKADLIIVGTRGIGGFKSLVIGSVAQKVVSYSKIPVLVVK
ncbi:MAG: universal stress protein [Peptococcaceae bacterium]|nr:universal stress protein [Peptococcaceae bacterium]MDH7524915.1 universal stress protein [Peptococcaceae bacterium]